MTAPNIIGFFIFLAMGLGVALPYIIMLLSPSILQKLPKPGGWIAKLINVMILLLALTIVWLLWVLAVSMSKFLMLITLISIIIITFIYWFKEDIAQALGSNIFRLLIVAIIVATLLPTFIARQKLLKQPEVLAEEMLENQWQDFVSIDIIDGYVKQGRTVFVDVTASWCITCQTNKLLVIDSDVVQQAFADNEVILIRADFSQYSQNIYDYLQLFQRYAVPMNVIYNEKYSQGKLLPTILRKKTILQYLN